MGKHNLKSVPGETLLDKIERNTEKQDECIVWKGALANGYGTVAFEGKAYRVHRQYWILKNGPIPDGLVVMHKCDNPACLNLNHLTLGTKKQNTADMIKKGRDTRWSKLTGAQVREIRKAGEGHEERTPKGLLLELAEKYGVTEHCIYGVIKRLSWKHLL